MPKRCMTDALRMLERDIDEPGEPRVPIVQTEPEHDPVKRPSHYTWIAGHECREIARHFSFNAGAAIKYIYRHGRKGSAVQDLRKAIECLQDEIARLERGGGG
jgi:hypothetical protein